MQLGLLEWAPPAPRRPPRQRGGHPVDPRVRTALLLVVARDHCGRERAATWEQLRQELRAEGVEVGVVRRLQEAAEELREMGEPVVGLSGDGIFLAVEADELMDAIEESEKRARKALRARRLLRRIHRRMLGQKDLGEAA